MRAEHFQIGVALTFFARGIFSDTPLNIPLNFPFLCVVIIGRWGDMKFRWGALKLRCGANIYVGRGYQAYKRNAMISGKKILTYNRDNPCLNHFKIHNSTKLSNLKIRCGAKDFMCGAKGRRERYRDKRSWETRLPASFIIAFLFNLILIVESKYVYIKVQLNS